jgi:hypothetical protein
LKGRSSLNAGGNGHYYLLTSLLQSFTYTQSSVWNHKLMDALWISRKSEPIMSWLTLVANWIGWRREYGVSSYHHRFSGVQSGEAISAEMRPGVSTVWFTPTCKRSASLAHVQHVSSANTTPTGFPWSSEVAMGCW